MSSWNTAFAYVIEFSKVAVQPLDEKGKFPQVVGKASGRVYVSYEGWGDYKPSALAGTFADIPVRYKEMPK